MNRKKFEKRKARERSVKAKTLKRRNIIQAKHKEERLERLKQIEINKIVNPVEPFLTPEKQKEREDSAKKKLEHNMEILKALEAEYDKEQALRKSTNESLEAQGHHTLEEKIAALKTEQMEKAEQAQMPQSEEIT
jgi:hypothetical protein